MITVSASQDFTAGKLAVALAYALGSGGVLYALMLGGRRLVDRLKPARAWVQAADRRGRWSLVAVAMTADLDLKFQNAIADDLPSVLVNPSGGLEESSDAVSDDARGGPRRAPRGRGGRRRRRRRPGSRCPTTAPAPDFVGTQEWFNTDGEPLSIARAHRGPGPGRADRLLDLHLHQLHPHAAVRRSPGTTEYRDDGLTIVGVHSPEFAFEKDAGNVADAIEQYGIDYPVVQDNELGTWTAFGNQYWPAKYLIDADGEVRYVHFGEGDYEQTEAAIRSLLAEAGARATSAASAAPEAAVERADPDAAHPGDLPRHRPRPGLGERPAARQQATTAPPTRARWT